MRFLPINRRVTAGDIRLKRSHLRRLQREAQAEFALTERSLRLLQLGNVNDSADRAHDLPPIGRIAVVSPPVNGQPAYGPVGADDAVHTAPLAFIGRVGSRFHDGDDGWSIALIEKPRCFSVSHLRAYRETQDAAKLRREARPIPLEIGLIDADAANPDGEAQQLIALLWRPNRLSGQIGSFAHGW